MEKKKTPKTKQAVLQYNDNENIEMSLDTLINCYSKVHI